MLPPIYVLCGDLTAGRTQIDEARAANFQTAINNPAVTGFLAPAPWNDSLFSQFSQVVAMSTKPFHVRMPTMPLPDGVPSFALNGAACGKVWDPAYLPLWQDSVAALLAFIQDQDLAGRFDGFRFSPVTPYDYDDEYGLQASTPDGGRSDAVFAAAGYTPSAYLGAAQQAADFINAQPVMAGKLLSVALYTPGNQPRVDDAGQVVSATADFSLPDAIVSAINAKVFISQKAATYTVFTDTLPDFWAGAGQTLGNLIVQMKAPSTDFPDSAFGTAFAAAVALNPLRIEVHESQVASLADAIAALPQS